MKKQSRMVIELDDSDMAAIIRVKNAADVTLDEAVFHFDEVHESLQDKVKLYGLKGLLADRTSEHKDKVAKLAAMHEVFDRLVEGEWQKERTVGAFVTSPEVEALAEIKGVSVPAIQKALAAYDKEAKAKILANPKVKARADEIRAERAEDESVDLDDLA